MMGLSSDDPEILCPDCKRLMVLLYKYEGVIDSQGHQDGMAEVLPAVEGLRHLLIFDSLLNVILAWFHRRKARRVCALHADYPQSLICPTCLFVFRRNER
jgi:hypothetical protein